MLRRQLRGILPRAPLSWQNILSGTVTELLCDAYSKSESDAKYALQTTVSSLDTRVTALEASGGGVPDPLTIGEVRGDGASLILRAGSSTVNVVAQDSTPLATFSAAENYFGGALRMRVDTEIYIDDATGTAVGLQLTLTGGSAGVRSAGALDHGYQRHGGSVPHQRGHWAAPALAQHHRAGGLRPVPEDDETKSLSRVLSVTRSASSAVVGLVVKNTASIGTARVQLDSNNATGLAMLEVSSASGCVLEAPGQEIRAAEPRHRAGGPCGNKWGDHDCLWPERFVGRQDQGEHQGRGCGGDAEHLRPAMPKRYDRIE